MSPGGFPFYIARRYIFSRKRIGAINIISGISVGGVALATMALVCVLSGFNGFRDLIGELFTAFDPQIEVVPAKEKFVATDDARIEALRHHEAVESASFTLEDYALILFRGRPTVIMLKGVDDSYAGTTGIESILYGEGQYRLQQGNTNYGIPGYGLSMQMGAVDFGTIQICVPRRGEHINLTNPIENINAEEITSCGVCFQVHQNKYDNTYMLAPLRFAQQLFEQEGKATALELKLKAGTDEGAVKAELQKLAGDSFKVRDRYEQQEETFNVMKIEKLFAFIFLAFIVLVASFNIIGSVSMLIIDKRNDMETLRSLGASDNDIVRIFLFEGRIITLLGAVIGIVLGLLLCFLQQQYGLLKLGGGNGNFIVDAYPVSVHVQDVVVIFITVVVVGFSAVWYPVRYLSRRLM